MAVSGSRDFILTRDNIIELALKKIGAVPLGGSATADMKTEAAMILNSMVLSWQNDDIHLWAQSDDVQLLTGDTANYMLDGDILFVELVWFRNNDQDTLLTPMTRQEYKEQSSKKDTGTPNSYYIDYQLAAPVMYLWPTPENSTGCVTGTDANDYICIKDHTSSSDDTPITGSNYATYWEQTSESGGVWATSTAYYSDVIRYTKILRVQDFDASDDNPDFPVRWYNALLYGLAVELGPHFGRDVGNLVSRAIFEKEKAQDANSESADMFLVPDVQEYYQG